MKGTSTLDIIWKKNSVGHKDEESKYGPYRVVGYVDSSYIRDIDDQKSITRYCFFVGEVMTTWYSKRQQIVLTSISKVKYVAMRHRVKERV